VSDRTRRGRAAVIGAWLAAAYLAGGLLLGLGAAVGLEEVPVHVPQGTRPVVGAIVLLVVLMVAGAGWGRQLARRAGSTALGRAGRAGALSFGPITLGVGIALALLERVSGEFGPGLPEHVLYGILFVPAVLCVTAVTAGAVGAALGVPARQLAAQAGLAAAGAFLVAALLMDAAGWRVGAPGAAARATMLVVTMVGNAAAALAGGAVVGGRVLYRQPQPR